jgi:hypothetical protein
MLQAGPYGVQILAQARELSLLQNIQTGSGTNSASYFKGTRSFFPGAKWPGNEADQSPPSSAKIKNVWSYTTTPPMCVHGIFRDNFSFLLIISSLFDFYVHKLNTPYMHFKI